MFIVFNYVIAADLEHIDLLIFFFSVWPWHDNLVFSSLFHPRQFGDYLIIGDIRT